MALFIDKLLHSLYEHDNGTFKPSHSPAKKKHHDTQNQYFTKKDPHHHHSSRKHRHCAKVKLDRVLADRKVCCCLDFGPCDIGFAVPPCSVLSGTINVTVLECEPVFCGPHQPVTLNLLLFIEEEFMITRPDGTKVPLEFSFHRKCTRCIPPIKDKCLDPSRIQCDIFNLEQIKSKIKFVCADNAFDGHATIAVHLDVVIALNLVIEELLCVALCHRHDHEENRLEPNITFTKEPDGPDNDKNIL